MLTEENLLELMSGLEYKPMSLAELEAHFAIDGEELQKLLAVMEYEGKVVQTRTQTFGVPEKMNLMVVKLQVKSMGFGFVIPEDSTKWEKDLYETTNKKNGAM